jgi:hypothetical protein
VKLSLSRVCGGRPTASREWCMRVRWQLVAGLLVCLVPAPALAQAPAPPTNDDCLLCHSDPETTRADGTPVLVDPKTLAGSIHKDHACVDCHVDLATVELPHAATVARVDCTVCHDGEAWSQSAHGRAFAAGVANAPTCKTCHGTHDVVRLDPQVRKYDVIRECGTCHADRLSTYRDTFHGQVTALGFARIATCADCHGAHEQAPSSDPRSWVSKERRLATCQQCHPTATAKFAEYQPHADKHDRSSNAVLYFTARFMEVLLLGVFGFFGVHTSLWFRRSWAERMRAARTPATPAQAAPPAPAPAPAEAAPSIPATPSQETTDDPSGR